MQLELDLRARLCFPHHLMRQQGILGCLRQPICCWIRWLHRCEHEVPLLLRRCIRESTAHGVAVEAVVPQDAAFTFDDLLWRQVDADMFDGSVGRVICSG